MLTESKEHMDCKERLAKITGGNKETYVTPTRRADVAYSENLFFEVKCRKGSSEKRKCDIEAIIRIGKKEYVIGKFDCNELGV